MMKSIKSVTLEKDNNFSWKAQFSTMLCGYQLMEYVEGLVDLSQSSIDP